GAELHTGEAAGSPVLTVQRARWNKSILVVAFRESADRNAAEALRGTQLFGSPEDREDDDEWYEEDLVGLAVHVQGRHIGAVTGLSTGAVQDLLEIEVEGQSETVLVPFVAEIVPEIDTEQGVVTLTPPPGLLTVNEAEASADADSAPDTQASAPQES
ncbi:MAG: ribosome maturation factor RimM, partial [Micrococcus sp.]|nr:ribosome maturation factor RimM [Micrococcus sp.]